MRSRLASRKPKPERPSRLIGWGLAIFLLSRLIVSLGYGLYISDLLVFHHSAYLSLIPTAHAYRDYFFPYPPLALLLYSWPIHVSTEFVVYRGFFHLAFLLIETWLVLTSLRVARDRLGLGTRERFAFLVLFSALGMLQGHLLYDRLDIALGLALTMSMLAFAPFARVRSAAAWNGGFLVKIIPVLWAPFTAILQEGRAQGTRLAVLLRATLKTFLAFVPSFVILFLASLWSDGAVWRSLSDQSERSIQIESSWASGLLLWKLINPSFDLKLLHKWGAQHIDPVSIPELVDFLARYLTWGFWLAGFAFLFANMKRLRAFSEKQLGVFHIYLLTAIVLGFVATQRVLSPQYFIWTMAPLALIAVHARSKVFAILVVALYTLTYFGFDVLYYSLINLNALGIEVVAARNAVALVTWAWLLWELRRQWRMAS